MCVKRICDSHEDFEAVSAQLKLTACPHCRCVGNLIRHGYLRGYDSKSCQAKTVRGWRIYCSNRGRAGGCGRTFSVWVANKIKRLFLAADDLWEFLRQAAGGGKLQAFRKLLSGLSDSAPYRIWRRFRESQSAIRVALTAVCDPPQIGSTRPEELTLAHLEAAFQGHPCPISAFQVQLQASFM